jgi:hypothetical protein
MVANRTAINILHQSTILHSKHPLYLYVVLAVFCISGAIAATMSKKVLRTDTLELKPGDFVFLGYDNGTYSKSFVSVGTAPIGRFQVSPALTNQVVRLEVDIQRPDTESYHATVKIMVGKGADSKELVTFNQPIPLEWATAGELAHKPLPRNRDAGPTEPLLLKTLQVHRLTYAKYRGEDNALVIAVARDPKEIIEAIKIPQTYVMYKWDFGFVIENPK